MSKRKKNITEAKGTILLVTATKAESIYFNQMRKDCRYMNLTVEWAGSDNLNLKQLIDITSRKKLAGRYQYVWALFGLDEVLAKYRKSPGSLSSNKFAAVRRTWNIYRNVERLSVPYSAYCQFWQLFHAALKRVRS